jgi:glycosyltransferase involved in cell wall biosynthesis
MLSHLPTVCVVIPALNEAEWIRTCLHSLAAVRYPPSLWEVIVADNGSTDATVELAQSFVLKLNLRVLQLPGVSVAALRNIAAGYTTAERLSFLDADCEVPPNWLEASAQAANVDPNAVLGAPYLVRPDAGWVATVWQHHEERAQDGSVSYVSTHNLHVSRQLFEELNGFDVSLEIN